MSEGFGFNIPMPEGLGEMIKEHMDEHDRRRMRAQDKRNRVYELLDSLNAEQLIGLRCLLNAGGLDDAFAVAQHFDGQVVSILRRQFGVDPDDLNASDEPS